MWLLDPKEWPHGGSWTPSTSAWPNEGGGSWCLLVDILERGPLPTRFFLSPTACAGILRRAKRRGRELPAALALALEDQAIRGHGPGLDIHSLTAAEREAILDLLADQDDEPEEELGPMDGLF